MTLGIGPGDEVITTPLTFAATVNVIEHVGASRCLADIEPDTLNSEPAAVGRLSQPRTRAIIAVHYAGHPADLDALEAASATQSGIESHRGCRARPAGASYKGRLIGAGRQSSGFQLLRHQEPDHRRRWDADRRARPARPRPDIEPARNEPRRVARYSARGLGATT